MAARFHYHDTVFRRLVKDQLLSHEDAEVTSHIERCAECQSKLEAVSEMDISWADVRRFLAPQANEVAGPASCTAGAIQTAPGTDEHTIEFLTPSKNPKSLGRFGRYEITEILGRGGMGVVMRGYDTALDRHSAIKVLAPELATNAAARNRFSREAKSAAAVVHEHVVPVQTVDEERGLPYLVMPVVEGKSLEQRVAQDGPLTVVEILRIGMQTASGLAAAHAQGLVHRDVKPANILLENGVERVMITDFGVARAADDANMTHSGVVAGTPQYMSPEQARGEDIDHRSDLFSLGSVLYFACTGRSPFRAETMMGVLNRITNDTPRLIRKINPDIPEWLQGVIMRLLDKDRQQRLQSASEVSDLLEQWLAHLQQPDVAPPPAEPAIPSTSMGSGSWRGKRTGLAAAGGAILIAAIVVILQWNKGTIRIDCARSDVPIRIMKGDKVHGKLTVTPGNNSVRIAAGTYVVEIDGEHDDLKVEDGEVKITRGGTSLVRIVQEFHKHDRNVGDHISRGKINLKRLGLAFHSYHRARGHLPPAVVIGPDGKTHHSWRIELLPYLEEPEAQELYDEYRMNEPWNSVHNRRLLSRMPDVFRSPKASPATTNSSYFVLTGEGTVFDGTKGMRFGDIKDGPSNTILLVEAQRKIPWTKPEDIPFVKGADVPLLQGLSENELQVLLVDGQVRALPPSVSEDTLRSLITVDDGQMPQKWPHAVAPDTAKDDAGDDSQPAKLLSKEISRLRNLVGELSIDDDRKTHVIAVETLEDRSWRWRVFLPQGTKFRWGVVFDEIPAAGIAPARERCLSGVLSDGEQLIDVKLYRGGDGFLHITVKTSRGVINRSVGKGHEAWTADRGMAVDMAGRRERITAGQMAHYTEIFDAGTPIVLLRYRITAHKSLPKERAADGHSPGLMVLLEPASPGG